MCMNERRNYRTGSDGDGEWGERLARRGHKVAGYDVLADKRDQAGKACITGVVSPAEFGKVLESPRTIVITGSRRLPGG